MTAGQRRRSGLEHRRATANREAVLPLWRPENCRFVFAAPVGPPG